MKPQNFEEKVVWYCLVGTYVLYILGAQFIVIPMMAWLLVLYLCKKLWEQTDATPDEEKITIPLGVWVWIFSMLLMALALVVGHLELELGTSRIIRSLINFFARTWALMALFPLIGCLKIRPKLLCRAVCILCLQSLILIPICYLALHLPIPNNLYVSPLAKLGGQGETLYNVRLYAVEGGLVRLRLFAPWSPALGLVGNIYLFLACLEPNKKWRWIGIVGAVAMILTSISRAAILCLPVIPLLTWFLANFFKPSVQLSTGVSSFFAGLFGTQIIDSFTSFRSHFDSVRSHSSLTRAALRRMALHEWNKSPMWGNGIVVRGPILTGNIPVGTHHTWFGLLFRHGAVGFTALVLPMLWTFLALLFKAQRSVLARSGLGITLVLIAFSFVENLDKLPYLYWPGLILIGMAFKAE